MKIELLDKTKKKKFLNLLEKSYGISNLGYLFIKSGKDKFRIFSGSLSKEELNDLAKSIHVELLGSRVANMDEENIRISFDAINIPKIKEQITENIIKVNDSQAKEWMKGNNLQISVENKVRYVAIKHKDDFLGVGRVQGDFIKNYVPKERRVK